MARAKRVSIIPCGAMHADLTWLMVRPGRTIRPRARRTEPVPWVEVPTHCVLVETDDGLLLWDTSAPRDWEERWVPTGMQEYFPYDAVSEEEYLDARLHQLGVGLEQIDYVVLSHLHFDHVGNANMFRGTDAKLVCHRKEYDFGFGFDGPALGGHLKADYADLPWETVEGDTEILPGVTLIEAPGHTAGCMSMQVDLADSGTVIFTSDAVYLGRAYGPPVVPPAPPYDYAQFLASVEKLRGIQERTDATMVFGHDADQMRQLRTAPDGYYT